MKRGEVYSSGFMKAQDLIDQGHIDGIVLTIKGSRIATLDDGAKQVVLAFAEDDRELGLNATNFDTIVELTGRDDSDNWNGAKICIYPQKLDRPYKGATHGVRVRAANSAVAPIRPAQPNAAAAMLNAPNNIEAARRAAFEALKATNPGMAKEALREPWTRVLSQLFPGKAQATLTATDWGVVKQTIEQGYRGEGDPALDEDLPF